MTRLARARIPGPLRLAAVLVLLAILATACSGVGEEMQVQAVFDDVVDLTTLNAVKLADVQVGTVAGIELTDDNRALVTMDVDPEIDLPAEVRAQLRKTNLLGERFVELVPESEGGTFDRGTTITDTRTVPELEETVFAGTELLMAVATDTLAGAITSSAQGLDGRGETFGTVIDNLNTMITTYDETSDDLVRLVRGLDGFLEPVGPQAALHGQALAELDRTTQVLANTDDLLVDSLVATQALAQSGTDIIREHRERFDAGFRRFDAITDEVVAPESRLDDLLPAIDGHDFNTIRGVNQEFAQILLDIIICGVNDTPGDPVRACRNPGSEQAPPTPRAPQDF
jgi:phospholipid/cholesterol/gamma-HCH transport system substrate-binding protein